MSTRNSSRRTQATPPVQAPARSRGAVLVAWLAAAVGALLLAFVALLIFSPGTLRSLFPFLVSPTALPTPSPTPVPGVEGRISFVRVSPDGRSRDLFVVNADGTTQMQLTQGIIVEGTALWSPDGTMIVLQAGVPSEGKNISTIVRVKVGPDNQPTEAVQLTADIKADSAFPAWSPDSRRIAFQSKRDGDLSQVYVMDADGNNKQMVSDGKGFAGQPAWSPDGQYILYISGEQQVAGSLRELYTVPANGGSPTRITQIGGSLVSPTWSPDGAWIACVQSVGQRDDRLLLMKPDGTDLRTLDSGRAIRGAQFSSDGKRLLYYAIDATGSDVITLDIPDGKPSTFTGGPADDYSATWAPGGNFVAWASAVSGNEHKIAVAPLDGSGRFVVSTGDGDDYQPSWGVTR